MLTRVLTTTLDSHGCGQTGAALEQQVEGQIWTALDTPDLATDQKVGAVLGLTALRLI